jgi:protein-S-isoprenylcysteine O-methyltransferase Ste14
MVKSSSKHFALIIVFISWTVFILFWMISAFSVKRDLKNSPWRRFAWLRIVIVLTIASLLLSRSSSHLFARRFDILQAVYSNSESAFVGVLLTLFGVGYAIWARVHLGRNWSPIPNVKENHELITSGPYRLVRHPIYTGIMMATLGTGFVIPLWLVVFVIMTAVFVWRVVVEENLMTKQFPNQYPEYKKRTWAFVPYVW